MDDILRFTGEYRWLSNFYPATVEYEGLEYSSVEHAYQAAKTIDPAERRRIRESQKPGDAKRMGKQVKVREDWEKIKFDVMTELVREKFTRHKDLQEKLLATGDVQLVEGNHWSD